MVPCIAAPCSRGYAAPLGLEEVRGMAGHYKHGAPPELGGGRIREDEREGGLNKSLQATRDGRFSSASRFTSFGPARLSSGHWAGRDQ